LQQIGIVNTSAGNAGFITSLYVVITPLLGIIFKQRLTKQLWFGVVLATIGLYFLSISGSFSMGKGDLFVLVGAFFFACHVLLIAWLSPQYNVLKISIIQFSVTAILSMMIAMYTEQIEWASIYSAAIPIIYGGVFSVGVAYTLQVAGQRKTKPSLAAIILSFEAFFAAIGGWLILNELFNLREILGCLLMLAGIIIAQIEFKKNKKWTIFGN
jgi:drug/metabolite transporter (DMT)-like permease